MSYLIYKTANFLPDQDGNLGTYRIKSQIGSVQFRYTFAIPMDFKKLISAKLLGNVSAGAAQTNRDIDLFINSHQEGEVENQKTTSDTTTLYDLSAFANKTYGLVFTSLIPTPTAGDTVGINVDHNGIGGTIFYFRLELIYC